MKNHMHTLSLTQVPVELTFKLRACIDREIRASLRRKGCDDILVWPKTTVTNGSVIVELTEHDIKKVKSLRAVLELRTSKSDVGAAYELRLGNHLDVCGVSVTQSCGECCV